MEDGYDSLYNVLYQNQSYLLQVACDIGGSVIRSVLSHDC